MVSKKRKEDSDELKAARIEAVSMCADAGMPQEQVRNFLKGGYVPLPWAMKFHAASRESDTDAGPIWIGLGGARGPGKSHASLAQAGLDDCQRIPGLKVLFLRNTIKSAGESLDDLVRKVFSGVRHNYTPSNGEIEFDNMSKILIGGYQNEKDINKYLGIEYDEIIPEEATQISEQKMVLLRGSLRSSKPEWRERIYLTTNPGGIGHGWFKKYLIEKRPFVGGKTQFIPSTYRDNPFLKQSYIDYLEALPGQLGKAWRDGDWDVFAGQAFPAFDANMHIVSPFIIPENWYRWRCIDYGYAAPWCCLWLARDPDTRRIYVYREAYSKNLSVSQQAERILDMTLEDEYIGMTYADPSMWPSDAMKGKITSTPDEYLQYGINLTRGDNKRISGKQKVDNLLVPKPDGKPGIVFFSTCVHIIEQMENLPVDPNRPEDVDTDAEDHAYDALRYGLSNVRTGAVNESNKEHKTKRHPAMDIKIF